VKIGRLLDAHRAESVYNERQEEAMDYPCPACGSPLGQARIVCAGCGEDLPLRVIVVSEGSRGGGFALVVQEEDQRGGQITSEVEGARERQQEPGPGGTDEERGLWTMT
jgi:uncharacterized Zn finger protein (UPF0148 family)